MYALQHLNLLNMTDALLLAQNQGDTDRAHRLPQQRHCYFLQGVMEFDD